jgi:hypothetical protein
MNPIQQLIADARTKRDSAITKARMDYRATMREIKSLQHRLRATKEKKPRYVKPRKADPKSPYFNMTTIQAAELVLREGKPLTLVELVVEVQERGCRMADDPRRVMRAIQGSLKYHSDRFRQDCEGRWSIEQAELPPRNASPTL